MSREPLAGTFEHLIDFVEVDVSALVRLSMSPTTEPYWTRSATHRFDDPANSFGVLYVGDSLETAFAESVIHDNSRFDTKRGKFQVSVSEFNRSVTRFTHPLGDRVLLADFTGSGLKRLGLNTDLCAGNDYDCSQEWAKAVHDALPRLDGILYPSRQHSSHLCVALFERSGVVHQSYRSMTARERIELCRQFNVEVV